MNQQSHPNIRIRTSLRLESVGEPARGNPNQRLLPMLPKKRANPLTKMHLEQIKLKENKMLAHHFMRQVASSKEKGGPCQRRASEGSSEVGSKCVSTPRAIKPLNNYSYLQLREKIRESSKYALGERNPNELQAMRLAPL